MKVSIFHYHLLQGGITSVIRESVRAIRACMPEVHSITLVCGRIEGLTTMVEPIDIAIRPEIDYLPPGADAASIPKHRRRIASLLIDWLDPDAIWWVHNHHLGKNSAFTAALIDVIRAHPEQRVILQIHDFPECARYRNLAALRAVAGEATYPQHRALAYALINARDVTLLREAGLDERRLFLLPNPVDVSRINAPVGNEPTGERRRSIRRRIAAACGADFPGFDPNAGYALYPVRTIRRKNVLEAGLIVLLAKQVDGERASRSCNLIVSFPGVSEQERPYSELVGAAFSTGAIPGLWGIASRLQSIGLSYADLLMASDLFISSSVQEGFGFTYFEAALAGKPLIARHLDILDGYDDLLRSADCRFYHRLDIPLDLPPTSGWRQPLLEAYRQRLREIRPSLSGEAGDRLEAEIEGLAKSDTIDFSYLQVAMQIETLRLMRDARFGSRVASMNSRLMATVGDALDAAGGTSADPVELKRRLSYDAFCERLRQIIAAISSTPSEGCDLVLGVQGALVSAFATLEHIRLLYGDGSGQ